MTRDTALRSSPFLPTLIVLAAGCLLVHAMIAVLIFAVALRGDGVGDWLSIYSAGTIVRSADAASLYVPETQMAVQRELFGRGVVNLFPLPAFAAFAVVPLALMPFAASYFVWLGVNLILLGALLTASDVCLRRAGITKRNRHLLEACAGLSLPVVNLLLLGQVDLVVLASIGGCYVLSRCERPWLAGLALALALVKPHFAAPIVLLLITTRQWRPLCTFAAAGAPLLVVPALILGPQSVLDQLSALRSAGNATTQLGINAQMMINLRGLFVSVGASNPWIWLSATALVAAVVLPVAVRIWARRPPLDEQSWALALLLPILYSPHAHMHSAVLLVAAFAFYVSARHRSIVTEWLLAGYVALTALFLLSLAGVSLTFIVVLAAFTWFATSWSRSTAASAGDQHTLRQWPDLRSAA